MVKSDYANRMRLDVAGLILASVVWIMNYQSSDRKGAKKRNSFVIALPYHDRTSYSAAKNKRKSIREDSENTAAYLALENAPKERQYRKYTI